MASKRIRYSLGTWTTNEDNENTHPRHNIMRCQGGKGVFVMDSFHATRSFAKRIVRLLNADEKRKQLKAAQSARRSTHRLSGRRRAR